jgi:hypothetical protein
MNIVIAKSEQCDCGRTVLAQPDGEGMIWWRCSCGKTRSRRLDPSDTQPVRIQRGTK